MIESLVSTETLVSHLQSKQSDLPRELNLLVLKATAAIDKEVKLEPNMPVITGNLQGSISIENISDYEKRIYPDEGIASYAEYVIKGVRGKAQVDSKDFLGGGFINAQSEVDEATEEFLNWLTN